MKIMVVQTAGSVLYFIFVWVARDAILGKIEAMKKARRVKRGLLELLEREHAKELQCIRQRSN